MKTSIIKFRVSIMEKRIIQQRAKQANLSVSEFLRKAAFNKPIKQRLTDEEFEIYLGLQKFLNDLQRIKNFFAKGSYPKMSEAVIEMISKLKEHLKKIE